MRRKAGLWVVLGGLLVSTASVAQGAGKDVVFWQDGFPTVSSEVMDQGTLRRGIGQEAVFADVAKLNDPATLDGARLLVLPYGSAVPVAAWKSVLGFVDRGGRLLILGGQALQVPVTYEAGAWRAGRAQNGYAAALGIRHTYEVPVGGGAKFAWKEGYGGGKAPQVEAKQYFAEEGRLDGLGYMMAGDGLRVAAPVVFGSSPRAAAGGRFVALDFNPAPGFWASADGVALVERAAAYARAGASVFSVETQYAVVRVGESPGIAVHVRALEAGAKAGGEVRVELRQGARVVEALTLAVGADAELPVVFRAGLKPGFYEVRAIWLENEQVREAYGNGFWVEGAEAVRSGPKVGAGADTLTLDGAPFLPVGTNYFGTEENGWDFSGPRNAANWERDFSEMEAHGVSFVRTGVWMPNARFIDGDLGGANERFLRNLEGFLLSAQRHHVVVNFTFFAFAPKSGNQRTEDLSVAAQNPYLDGGALRAEQAFVRSVVVRFREVPFLSWDLINEPSFDNPRQIFRGNVPNGDQAELAAWRKWLREHYADVNALADAWSVTAEELRGFDQVSLPSVADLNYERSGDPRQVRAVDYNLFAQEMFSGWVKALVGTIREAGSGQVVNVGQDEGGVTNRVLNQFYAGAGVGFTTNHTYWEDDALLWDSVAAKVVGLPNITGETGYQPAWAADGVWRYDELTGLGLTERKWALGFAAGSSGAVQWDWAREVDFGMLRSDGSAKIWQPMMQELGAFARAAAPFAKGLRLPEIALVLPESLQLSVLNGYALEAQQTAVRALYGVAHGATYAVGEYQIQRLGEPRLILLPSAMGLTDAAWAGLEARVRAGATLLVTGPFDADAHLHGTERAAKVGLDYRTEALDLRENTMHWPGGEDTFSFGGKKTTVLTAARLGDGGQWKEVAVGQGRILFAAYPLELGGNLDALGRVYGYAMRRSGVKATAVEGQRAGVLVCPTEYAEATLYVVTSETEAGTVAFTDRRSGKRLTGTVGAGRAAMVMVKTDGTVVARYHWAE